jgi:proteic killer suppression protein
MSPTGRYESDTQTRYKAIAQRDVSHHNLAMIVSWKHKGLKVFFETGSTKGINADHAKRLRRVLLVLNRATHRDELDMPGWRFHRLKGDLIDYWSVSISGNWRIIFRMFNDQVELVDYLDYH